MFQNAERKGMELSPQIGQIQCHWVGCECEKSHKIFDIRSRLIKHLLFHSQYKSHGCNECSLSFARGSDLLRHVRNQHKTKSLSTEVEENDDDEEMEEFEESAKSNKSASTSFEQDESSRSYGSTAIATICRLYSNQLIPSFDFTGYAANRQEAVMEVLLEQCTLEMFEKLGWDEYDLENADIEITLISGKGTRSLDKWKNMKNLPPQFNSETFVDALYDGRIQIICLDGASVVAHLPTLKELGSLVEFIFIITVLDGGETELELYTSEELLDSIEKIASNTEILTLTPLLSQILKRDYSNLKSFDRAALDANEYLETLPNTNSIASAYKQELSRGQSASLGVHRKRGGGSRFHDKNGVKLKSFVRPPKTIVPSNNATLKRTFNEADFDSDEFRDTTHTRISHPGPYQPGPDSFSYETEFTDASGFAPIHDTPFTASNWSELTPSYYNPASYATASIGVNGFAPSFDPNLSPYQTGFTEGYNNANYNIGFTGDHQNAFPYETGNFSFSYQNEFNGLPHQTVPDQTVPHQNAFPCQTGDHQNAFPYETGNFSTNISES